MPLTNWRAPHWGYNLDEIRRNIRKVFWLYFALFAILAIYLIKFIIVDSKDIVTSQYNPRLRLQNPSITRGDILDSRGYKLAYTDDSGKRVYPLANAASHAVGYYSPSGAGFYGAEAKYSFKLQNAGNEIWQRLSNIPSAININGDSIVLTIDAELQAFIYNQIKDYNAGSIIIEPATGKVLAMVSSPGFDPNVLTGDFSVFTEGALNSPLVNRATQGKYPPGSVYKIITAAAAMELSLSDGFTYACTGQDIIGGKQISCYNSTAHGVVDLTDAFALSCNTYFSIIGLQIGADNLRSISERFYFNSAIPFPLEYGVSSFPLNKASDSGEIVDTAIGQGKILTSPLQIALTTATVANNGILMAPYILDHTESYDGQNIQKTIPVMAKHVFSSEISAALTDMMIKVTEYGTGARAAVPNLSIAAKTGSAETPNGADHGWFTAFFPADNPQFVLCIIIENIGGSSYVLPIGKNIIEYLTN